MNESPIEGVEEFALDGQLLAVVIRGSASVDHTTFVSPPESSLQFGLLAHPAGYCEPAHVHKRISRSIEDVQQMFVVQRGTVLVDLFRENGELLREIRLGAGDAILLMSGAHRIRVLEDAQCVTVKQGPFLGLENDKVNVQVAK